MDTATLSSIKLNTPTIAPAQLWLGAESVLLDKTVTYLQNILCSKQGCTLCSVCSTIKEHRYYAITWMTPEKQYTLEDLHSIFETINFVLEPHEHHFFIIQKADFLGTACANSLLKSLEEPPAGYHFILLAQRHEQVLQTVRSRCITTSFIGTTSPLYQSLFDFFVSPTLQDPSLFLKELEQSKIHESDSIELLDTLLLYWINTYKSHLLENKTHEAEAAYRMVTLFLAAWTTPPMPGSSKLFWKNLFLQTKN